MLSLQEFKQPERVRPKNVLKNSGTENKASVKKKWVFKKMVLREKLCEKLRETSGFFEKKIEKKMLEKAIKESRERELRELNVIKGLEHAFYVAGEAKKTSGFKPSNLVSKNLKQALKSFGEHGAKKTLREYYEKIFLIIDQASLNTLKTTINNMKKKHEENLKTCKLNTKFLVNEYFEKYGRVPT